MPYSLRNQHFAFPADSTPVFVLWIWRSDHCAHTRLATLECQQCPRQCLSINLVGLNAPTPTRGRDRSCINYVTLNPVRFQNPMDTKAIQSSLLDRHYGKRLPCS